MSRSLSAIAELLVFATGTYGAAVTFVCGANEKDTLGHFAAVCNVCISPLPGRLLAIFELLMSLIINIYFSVHLAPSTISWPYVCLFVDVRKI